MTYLTLLFLTMCALSSLLMAYCFPVRLSLPISTYSVAQYPRRGFFVHLPIAAADLLWNKSLRQVFLHSQNQ